MQGIDKVKRNNFNCVGQMLEYRVGKGESFPRGSLDCIIGKISALKGGLSNGKVCPGGVTSPGTARGTGTRGTL